MILLCCSCSLTTWKCAKSRNRAPTMSSHPYPIRQPPSPVPMAWTADEVEHYKTIIITKNHTNTSNYCRSNRSQRSVTSRTVSEPLRSALRKKTRCTHLTSTTMSRSVCTSRICASSWPKRRAPQMRYVKWTRITLNTVFINKLCFSSQQEQFLRTTDSVELNIDISDLNLGTLKKAFNYARTRLKVSFDSAIMRIMTLASKMRFANATCARDLMQTI